MLEDYLKGAAAYAHREFEGGGVEITAGGVICKIIYRNRFGMMVKVENLTPWGALRGTKTINPLVTAFNDLLRQQQQTEEARKAMVTPSPNATPAAHRLFGPIMRPTYQSRALTGGSTTLILRMSG